KRNPSDFAHTVSTIGKEAGQNDPGACDRTCSIVVLRGDTRERRSGSFRNRGSGKSSKRLPADAYRGPPGGVGDPIERGENRPHPVGNPQESHEGPPHPDVYGRTQI